LGRQIRATTDKMKRAGRQREQKKSDKAKGAAVTLEKHGPFEKPIERRSPQEGRKTAKKNSTVKFTRFAGALDK